MTLQFFLFYIFSSKSENRSVAQSPKMEACCYVRFVEIEPSAITLMPLHVNHAKRSSEGTHLRQRWEPQL